MRLALSLLALLTASPVFGARFVGDAEGMYVLAVAATADGGFVMVGSQPAPWGTPADGLVIAIDAAGNTTWAAEVEGMQLRAVAALPDGGVLVGGGPLLARLAPGGAVMWQQEWESAFINAVACDGTSSCAVSGSETFLHAVTFIELDQADSLGGPPDSADSRGVHANDLAVDFYSSFVDAYIFLF